MAVDRSSGVELRAVSRTQGNNRALKAGLVDTGPYRLRFEEVPVLVDAFRRMVRTTEFDVCEMALTTYVCAKRWGKPFTALPIFLVRGFHHGAVRVRPGSVRSPKELEDTRVGVARGYTVTTGVWARGILQNEYGVDLDRITWVCSGDEHVAEVRLPGNVERVPPGSTIEQLLAAGDLSAVVGDGQDGLVSLIPDPDDAALAAFGRGHYPINHLVVVRDELLARYPDLAQHVATGFAESKQRYVERLRAGTVEAPTVVDRMHRRVLEVSGGADPLPYGVARNRQVLEELLDHIRSQHILDGRPALEDLFAPGTLDWAG